jgi:hypothetical protein
MYDIILLKILAMFGLTWLARRSNFCKISKRETRHDFTYFVRYPSYLDLNHLFLNFELFKRKNYKTFFCFLKNFNLALLKAKNIRYEILKHGKKCLLSLGSVPCFKIKLPVAEIDRISEQIPRVWRKKNF